VNRFIVASAWQADLRETVTVPKTEIVTQYTSKCVCWRNDYVYVYYLGQFSCANI